MQTQATTRSVLPLRLAVEPWIREFLRTSCFILPSIDEENLCFVITNHGLLAFVMNGELTNDDILKLSQLPETYWPFYSIVRQQSEFHWYFHGTRCFPVPSCDQILQSMVEQSLTRPVAKAILESITRYYSRQVLEPSIRGFLGILEKQFPRNDLYLFELLQNAVDDGASMVVMKSFDHMSSSQGLFFCHNGRSFSPLDILGLASVGLSTKGAEEKKKIGFMGVGFKAVYKRFSCVTIYDHVWNFQFREPSSPPLMEPTHSWVMKPIWMDQFKSLDSIIPQSETFQSDTWCHFTFEYPRGGLEAVRNDLAHLSYNVPVLLGRQFLFNSDRENRWTLIWENTKYQVRYQSRNIPSSTGNSKYGLESTNGKFMGNVFDRIELSLISLSQRTKRDKLFQFLTVYYHPTRKAQIAFESHTKKSWSSQAMAMNFDGKDHLVEEISLFFELGMDGLPIMGTGAGRVHAILPTKLHMPCFMNLQGSWLLSVDRQDVQSVSDNDWNNCLINQYPRLFILLARWIADHVDIINSFSSRSNSLKSFYRLFPKFVNEQSKLTLPWLNHVISMEELTQSFKFERLIPVYSISNNTTVEEISFCTQSEAIWLPSPIMRFVSPTLVHTWFDRWPFISRDLDDLSYDVLWTTTLVIPTVELLRSRKPFFSFDSLTLKTTSLKIRQALSLLAAFGALQQSPEKDVYDKLLPSIEAWPIFLTERGETVTLQEIVWFSPDEHVLNDEYESLYSDLRRGALLAAQSTLAESTKTTSNGKTPMPASSSHFHLLDADLDIALRNESFPDIPSDIWNLAKVCVKSAQLFASSHIIGIDSSCGAILSNMALNQQKVDVSLICKIFHWAMKNSRYNAISHLLVNKSMGFKLIPSSEAYIRSQKISEDKIIDLLPYVSDVYLNEVTRSDSFLKLYRNFLMKCGCQIGVSLVARTRPISLSDKSYLPNHELPKLRQSNPSVPLFLPFNLGQLTRKKVEIVDIILSPEWETILDSAANDVSLAENLAEMICDIFSRLDVSSTVTSESTPYLKCLLQGRSDDSLVMNITNSTHRIPSDYERYPPPAFSRMFYLPPAQPGIYTSSISGIICLGAEVKNLGPAQWISRISRSKWVPANLPGSENEPPSIVLSPCEVLLAKDGVNALEDIMPVAKLQPHHSLILQSMMPSLKSLFAWGSVAPPPAIEQFESLCANDSLGLEVGGIQGVVTCSRSKYLEVSNIWISLLHALKQNRLTVGERSRVSKAIKNSGKKLHILPGFTPNTFVSISRCVSLKSLSTESDEETITSIFCQLGYLYDLSVGQIPSDWILASYLQYLLELVPIPRCVASAQIQDYLTWQFFLVSTTNKFTSPSALQKLAFTYSLWILTRNQLTVSERENLFELKSFSSHIVDKTKNYLKEIFPHFAVYCKRGYGHSLEYSNLSGEWIFLWNNIESSSPYRPILIDDQCSIPKGCGVLKSSLLKQEYHLEPISILDHCLNPTTSSHLLNIERFLRAVLDIPSVSDSKYFSLAAKSGGGSRIPLPIASDLLRIIVHLICLLDQRNIQINEIEILTTTTILRCQTLSLIFRYPKLVDEKLIGLSESTTISVYAIRGAPIKSDSCESKVQSFLISGNSCDYVPELEELILSMLYGNHRPSITRNIRKALSLLNHIESESEFLKYFERYFPDFLSLQLGNLPNEPPSSKLHDELFKSIENLKHKQTIRQQVTERNEEPSEDATSYNQPMVPQEDRNDTETERKNIGAAESFLSSLSDIASDPLTPPLRSQGRGICNLPSWMTSEQQGGSELSNLVVAKKRPFDEPTNVVQPVALPPEVISLPPKECPVEVLRGRGRGVSNLPAWMSLQNPENIEPDKKRLRTLDETQFADASEGDRPPSPAFHLVIREVFDLISECSKYSTSLPLTISKLSSLLSSLSEDQEIELKRSLTGALKQELLTALTRASSSENPYASLRTILIDK